MTYLLIAVLLFGLFQSLLELKKDDAPKKAKSITKRILAISYILSFFIGVILIFLPDKQNPELNKLITSVSALTTKVNSNSKIQIDSLIKLKKLLEDLNQNLTKKQRLTKMPLK